ncbi:MAG: hypothetical protein M1818_004478 [Claussenomyces sp. TS43310]|nr:MAG: hypothetical protein M1818_004478 [Claussenomyces sp. TS43310]
MASPKALASEATPLGTITSKASLARTTFRSQRTKPLSYRLSQLRKLYWALVDNTDLILESCKTDLNKSAFETYVTELDWCKNDIVFVTQHLSDWMKDEAAPYIPFANKVLSPQIRKDPLGAVLVIGCWNFPLQLSLGPLIGAVAAGCTAILKPSEVSPTTAMVLKKVVEDALDPEAYSVVIGGVEESTALLNEKWDKIFYTGNAQVGTIIAKKAAETLTPVTLELGGRNPAIVTKNADASLAARRLLWGKVLNAGQVCISQNYTLVDKEILDSFVDQLKTAMKEFFPKGAKESPDFGRIVNERHFHRIKKMLDSTKGKILIGGNTNESEKFIEPTVILVQSENDPLIENESFGPLIPILAYADLGEAIRIANSVHATPLGLYPFGTKIETDRILSEVISGGASVNDAFFHGSIPTLAFGGVGDSGQGAYRGKASFDTFTHRRSVTTTPGWVEKLIGLRYPPYAGKISKLQFTQNLQPDFDRQGRQIKGLSYWLAALLSLGGVSTAAVLMRWIGLAAMATATKKYLETSRRSA